MKIAPCPFGMLAPMCDYPNCIDSQHHAANPMCKAVMAPVDPDPTVPWVLTEADEPILRVNGIKAE